MKSNITNDTPISFSKGAEFPFQKRRILRYRENIKIFEGQHFEVFEKWNSSRKLYVYANLAGIICKKSADFLFGEEAIITAGTGDNTPEAAAIERLIADNYLGQENYEAALSAAVLGDAFYRIRYGQEYGGELPAELDPFRVFIENVSAIDVFPEVNPMNRRQIKAYHLCVPCYNPTTEDWTLQCESHYAGFIQYHSYELEPQATDIDGIVETWKIGRPIGNMEVQQTGVPFPLIVHVPNTSRELTWEGLDDLSEHKAIFDEINNRLSQIAAILDKHADPALAVPTGLLAEDASGRPYFRVAQDKVFEVLGKDDIIPQYITWNGNLQEAIAELDKLVEMLLISAEIPPIALGMNDSGTSGSSGLSIKFRMQSLLSKVNRKKLYFNKGVVNVLYIAQMLEKALGIADYEPVRPKIVFKDGLPVDSLQEVNEMNVRTGGMPTISRKTALMRLDNLTEAQADAEIEKIMKEQEEMLKMADPTAFQTPASGEEEKEAPPENEMDAIEQQKEKADNADEFGGYDPRKDGI